VAGDASGTPHEDEPIPKLGIGAALKEAHFVAAPLLTAAALSLAGVVGGADDEFRWPGPTLLLLVITAMTLIFSIQLGYNARRYLYTYQELKDRYEQRDGPGHNSDAYVRDRYTKAQSLWRERSKTAVLVYDIGTLLLGLGVAASLAPPDCGKQVVWRWSAAVIVFLGTVADGLWVWFAKNDS
jgi:hypothetical protein